METIIKTSPVKTRRKFDTTFKLESVRNWLGSGKSAAIVAKELGLTENLLYAWRKLLPPAEAGSNTPLTGRRSVVADLQAELDAPRREIRHIKEQRDILKKRWASSPNRLRAIRTGSRAEKRPSHRHALRRPPRLEVASISRTVRKEGRVL